jgi:hypothetical protein
MPKNKKSMWRCYAQTGGGNTDSRTVIAEDIGEAADKAAAMFHEDYRDNFKLSDISKIELLGTED